LQIEGFEINMRDVNKKYTGQDDKKMKKSTTIIREAK
jgi:hypothetical protein